MLNWVRRHVAVPLVKIVTGSVFLAGCGVKHDPCESISLDAQWTHIMPSDFILGGASVEADGAATVWSAAGHQVLRVDGDGAVDLEIGGFGPVAAARHTDAGLQVVAVEPLRVRTPSANGARVDTIALGPVQSVVAAGSGWALQSLTPDSTMTRVHWLRWEAGEWVVEPIGGFRAPRDSSSARYWLTGSRTDSYLTNADQPWQILRLDSGTNEVGVLGPSDSTISALSNEFGSQRPAWFALGSLNLGPSGGLLQTLVDRRSDLRVVMRYRPDGSLISRTTLKAPIAFIASADSGAVLATRRVSGFELVLYRLGCVSSDD